MLNWLTCYGRFCAVLHYPGNSCIKLPVFLSLSCKTWSSWGVLAVI